MKVLDVENGKPGDSEYKQIHSKNKGPRSSKQPAPVQQEKNLNPRLSSTPYFLDSDTLKGMNVPILMEVTIQKKLGKVFFFFLKKEKKI